MNPVIKVGARLRLPARSKHWVPGEYVLVTAVGESSLLARSVAPGKDPELQGEASYPLWWPWVEYVEPPKYWLNLYPDGAPSPQYHSRELADRYARGRTAIVVCYSDGHWEIETP